MDVLTLKIGIVQPGQEGTVSITMNHVLEVFNGNYFIKIPTSFDRPYRPHEDVLASMGPMI